MAYIGRQLVRGQNRVLDDISGSFNGSTTAFNLTVSSSSSPPASVNQLWIILGGVLQKPGTDFTVADAVITFTTAPASTLNFWGMIQGDTSDINSPADASVTPSKIANSGDFAFPADVRFNDADGSHYVGLQAPSTVSSNLVWTLPAADGSANQLLKTDGSGALGWVSDTQSNLLDEDNMSSNSATQPASQQSIKAYADTKAVLTGSTNNTICTVTGAHAITGEAKLTFNGSGDLTVTGNEGTSANLYLIADEGDDNGDGWRVGSNQDDNDLTFANNTSGSYVDKITILKTGQVCIGTTTEGYTGAEDLTVYKNGDAGLTIRSSTSGSGTLAFSDGTSGNDEYRGYVQYQHGTNTLALGTNAVNTLSLLAGGNVKILDGDLVIGTSGHGIDFSAKTPDAASGTPSEILSDYEFGAWVPTADSGCDGLTYAAANTYYQKVGRVVDIWAQIYNPTNLTSDPIRFAGLPFTPTKSATGVAMFTSLNCPSNAVLTMYIATDNTLRIYRSGIEGDAAWAEITGSEFTSNGQFYMHLSYIVAS